MKELYNNLMAMIDSSDKSKFYFKDFNTAFGTKFRIFGYHYAQYSDWLKPDALECRGIMFEMGEDGEPVRIAARPMEKFFNLEENPFTIGLDLSKISLIMDKMDGSLISTYVDGGTLRTKSKMSLFSQQAVESYQLFLNPDNAELRKTCLELGLDGYTCNFEYISPTNRVVIAYKEKGLVLLNVRNNETGEYIPHKQLYAHPVLRSYLVNATQVAEGYDPDQMVEEIRQSVGIEGFIFKLESGQFFKLKTYWYSNLHRVKSTIESNEYLFQTVVGGASDDIKSLFEDEYSKTKIDDFESVFLQYLKSSINQLNEFYSKYNAADRRTYAIEGQTYFKNLNRYELFSVLMLMYGGKLDADSMVEEINKVFLKQYLKYVPAKYLVNQVESED